MCHCANLSLKIAVQNSGSVCDYFCGGHKYNLWLQEAPPENNN